MPEQRTGTSSWRDTIGKFISLAQIQNKTPRYWISAAIVLIFSFAVGPYVYNYLNLTQARGRLFQYLLAKDPRPLEPSYVKVVLVEDDEYWGATPPDVDRSSAITWRNS